MNRNNLLAPVFLATSAIFLGASFLAAQDGELLFQDPLTEDTSANWTAISNAPENIPGDWVATFAWDYAAEHGLPASPNAVGGVTRGLRLQVNRYAGASSALTLFPNGQHFSGNYVLKFDMWMNFTGYLGPVVPIGAPGSTEFATFGIGADGLTEHRFLPVATPAGAGAWFAITGDGENSLDVRAMANGSSLVDTDGGPFFARRDPSFDPEYGARRTQFQPYYHTIFPGGDTFTQQQFELSQFYPEEYSGETPPGVAGFRWHEVRIEVIGGTVTWYIDDLPIAEITPEIAGMDYPTEGNIHLGYFDHASSIVGSLGIESEFNYVVYSNVRVYSLPDATGFASWAETSIADEEAREPEDNPAGDGISNLLKYALGLDPASVASPSALPVRQVEDDGGTEYLTLTAARNPDATDVILTVEVSSDLVNWESGEGHTVVLTDDGTTLKVRDTAPASGVSRRFIRLSASLSE